MKLYGYWRSTAAYRVRIALAMKGIPVENVPVDLAAGDQRHEDFVGENPQGLVPVLELDDGTRIAQSMAILEWLEETRPEPPLYPDDAFARARCRAQCLHVACDIHPLNNLRVLQYLRSELAHEQSDVDRWYAHWIERGFAALECELRGDDKPFSLGDKPGMVEVLLVPQMYNARRFQVPVDDYPTLVQRDADCRALPAFAGAAPDRQVDAPQNA